MFSSGRATPYRRKVLIGEERCASYLSSGERLFAGGERVEGGCSSAKPRWSEVIIFLEVVLRQGNPFRE
jgi:hypothetical protein